LADFEGVIICDASGKTVYNGKMESEISEFVVSVAGVYFVRCNDWEMVRVVVK